MVVIYQVDSSDWYGLSNIIMVDSLVDVAGFQPNRRIRDDMDDTANCGCDG